jgi:hypothetical protein
MKSLLVNIIKRRCDPNLNELIPVFCRIAEFGEATALSAASCCGSSS